MDSCAASPSCTSQCTLTLVCWFHGWAVCMRHTQTSIQVRDEVSPQARSLLWVAGTWELGSLPAATHSTHRQETVGAGEPGLQALGCGVWSDQVAS